MNKLKILFISHTFPPTVGGVETQNFELSVWLPAYAEIKLMANKRRWMLPFFLLYAPIKAILISRKYDVILLGSGILGNACWLIKKITKKPVIIITHGLDLTWKNKFYQKLWVNNFIPTADKLIAVGNETITAGIERGIPTEKFVFIPNGVDTEKNLTEASRADLERITGQSTANKKILMTSGRLAKRKGVAWFISNVMPKLNENFLYIVAGAGPDKENINQAIKDNSLENRVIMLGYIPDQDRNILWATADLFVQPNIKIAGDMEGFGISVIEAGACRLPVLASDLEGLKDAIKEGKNGFLVESENTQEYVQKINELFENGSPREIYGESVRNYVIENYQWKNIAKIYLGEINKIITKN
ncbi:MAG: Glycosyl transferase, group 1 family [Candidatus Moranbacteria bacterium GW2011_GWE1_36_7]|nr:MAG: Glycosyl transferase, group 1 family [Candidatus Moranbacteria bacterium GW2011_GWD2_36_12]KKQ04754.1 MAG: Glycosyl transferase, group 1 family [Candidatus Moranbacteria bacterium GW2011_GWE2_36_40]KKQ13544.1 MAG: Glycosyl transferase, group 1 family [Candidatus Moranbacteria bacterium GW2011_GWE1_36_7]